MTFKVPNLLSPGRALLTAIFVVASLAINQIPFVANAIAGVGGIADSAIGGTAVIVTQFITFYVIFIIAAVIVKNTNQTVEL